MPRNQYVCAICDGNFETKTQIQVHVIKYHTKHTQDLKLLISDVIIEFEAVDHSTISCEKTLNKTNPNRVRNGRKKLFECEICKKLLSSFANVKRHVKRIHSEERPFNCSFCEKTFKISHDVRKHERIHKKGS